MASATYHDGLLHTSSAYFLNYSIVAANDSQGNFLSSLVDESKIKADYVQAFNYARSKEIAFYQTFFPGVTSYDVFIRKLRELLNKADEAGKKIKQLENANLRTHIQMKKGVEEQVHYHIKINSTQLGQLPGIPTSITDGKLGDEVYLSLSQEAETKAAKTIINKINKTNFDDKSPNAKAITKWAERQFTDVTDDVANVITNGITISRSGPSKSGVTEVDTQQTYFKIGQFPFLWSKKEIAENRAKGDKEFEVLFKQAKDTVYNFLKGQMQINDEGLLNDAFEISWRSANVKLEDFFFEGDNLIKAVLGNIGEFQLLLWTNYVAMATKKYTPELAKIIGDEAKDGRGQNRSDFQLMTSIGADIGDASEAEAIGIQSKNVSEARYKEIQVNTDLGLIAPNLGDNITTSIANYQFNASIADEIGNMEEILETYVDKYIWRVLNFNVNSDLESKHTNTFYWLGGNKLIPVSSLIFRMYNSGGSLSLKQMIKKPETTITGLQRGSITDFGYNMGDHPLFLEYWHGNMYTSWTPTSENPGKFESLIAGIGIHTTLDIASFLDVTTGKGRFEIFTS